MANLVNLASGDRLNLRAEGQILASESIKNGKTRQTQKEFESIDETQKACVKKEWESLKKGYVLQNANAKVGEASLHVYIGGGYTGALAFAGAGGEFFVYKCGGYKEGGTLDDFLVRLDASGAVKQQTLLPKPLAWHAERAGEVLLLDLDHDIFKFNPQTGEFTNVFKELKIKRNGDITSCVCASGETAAFAAYGQIYVLRDGGFSSLGKYKTDSGCGAAFCIALSTDGAKLALSCKQNEIKILNALNGEILNEIRGDFGIFDKICFLADGSLLGKERYAGKLVCLDAASGERLEPAWLRGEYTEADELCVSADGLRLALINYDKARIIDLKSGNLQLIFELSHVVKRCEAKFERINGEEFLAVRTDYGCFSLYKI
ncbi:MAG: WD40 repeat domain-containing protein [Campylobacter sp.]|uniref:WD40 repeat domain-containing protein n=1 Tax=Campylobacter sp. TaxID=205 RepID=UPI00360FB8D7